MKIKAFTLAEVLITLSILGIVAAITIPSIIHSYNERVTITRVKKMYSTLNNVYSNVVAQDYANESRVFGYTEKGATDIADMLKPYLQISKDCGTDKSTKRTCGMAKDMYYKIDGTDHTNYTTNNKYYGLRLKDNSLLWFRGYDDDTTIAFWYDVNGEKGPNTFGKDVFHFAKYGNIRSTADTTSVRPVGDTESTFESRCKTGDGMGCTGWLVVKGNMDYLKCRSKLSWNMNKCP